MAEWFDELKRRFPEEIVGDSLELAKSMWNHADVQLESRPELAALALSKFLANYGIYPLRITSRPSESKINTINWYKKYLPWVPSDKILVRDDDNASTDFKHNTVAGYGIGFHLDDSIEHSQQVASLGVWVGLVDQEWNEYYLPEPGSRIIRARGYLGRPAIIRTFLSLRDAYIAENYSVAQY